MVDAFPSRDLLHEPEAIGAIESGAPNESRALHGATHRPESIVIERDWEDSMSPQQDSGGSGVNVVAIIAILVLIGLAAWFFMGRPSRVSEVTNTTTSTVDRTNTSDSTHINYQEQSPSTTPDTSTVP